MLYGERVSAGEIPMVDGAADPYALAWWSPDPRPVITMADVALGSGLTKTLRTRRRWTTTVNRAFDRVLAECRRGRQPQWLTDELVDVLTELHEQGWYHSIEVWSGTDLVGGALGLGTSGVFSADTMFYLESGASQIALAELTVRLTGTSARWLDLQWDSPHVRRLEAVYVERGGWERVGCRGVSGSGGWATRRPGGRGRVVRLGRVCSRSRDCRGPSARQARRGLRSPRFLGGSDLPRVLRSRDGWFHATDRMAGWRRSYSMGLSISRAL
jgi:leucyl/phenylalanyl-tRNA--protein transferase